MTKKKRVSVHVGTLEDMGKRFVGAWKRAAKGEKVREEHVTLPDLPALLNALSPKRLELLSDVRRGSAASIRELATRLGRDYKRVHEDVETLAELGLLSRTDGGVSAPYDVIRADFDLRKVA